MRNEAWRSLSRQYAAARRANLSSYFYRNIHKTFSLRRGEGSALWGRGGGEEASRWNGETVPASECKRSAKNLAISGLPMSASDLCARYINRYDDRRLGRTGACVRIFPVLSSNARFDGRKKRTEKADAKGDAEKVGQQGQDMQDD
jgi:hypothetical protein